MKLKLFGNNISPDCRYCNNNKNTDRGNYCIKNKRINNGKCRRFDYNPLLRTPKPQPNLNTYNQMDFIL